MDKAKTRNEQRKQNDDTMPARRKAPKIHIVNSKNKGTSNGK